uniref:Uncharacterized protein n=1 Tax=Anguilla anguilla TaxID=7936 RepID=A0A0E9TIJ7_ANGAN
MTKGFWHVSPHIYTPVKHHG